VTSQGAKVLKNRGAFLLKTDTAGRRPVAMVYAEQWSTLAAAVRREKQLKRWSSLKKEALIKRDSGSLKAASRHRT